MLEKGKEPVTKDTDEEPFFDDTKFAVDLLKSAFRKLEDVAVALNILAHQEVDKDPRVGGETREAPCGQAGWPPLRLRRWW
jgi:SOS response regulatory protein OraA/RecX